MNLTNSLDNRFDGDQVSVIMPLDEVTANELSPLEPYMNVFSMSAPRKISGNPALSKPAVATIANALHAHHPVDPVVYDRMVSYFNLK